MHPVVCREGGARVAHNIEVLASGCIFRHRAQLVLDATIVSPVTRACVSQLGADIRPWKTKQKQKQNKDHNIPYVGWIVG